MVTNLLYYQTNYFVVALAFIIFACFLHSRDVAAGLSAIGFLAAVAVVGLSKNPQLVQVILQIIH